MKSSVTAGADITACDVDAIVIGSGFAGLYALYKLRNELGLDVRAFENASDVGGTWYWNRYPGARSDTEVSAYCYYFDRELYDSWKWSQRYPRQPEILTYLENFADRYDLRRSITFDTNVTKAAFDDVARRWEIETDAGEHWTAQFLIEGVGLLSSTNFPTFPGQDSFGGDIYHTSRWPHKPVDFSNKRVGVIGTGASGIQVIAELGEAARHLTVFQRTPQYVVPAQHGPISQQLLEEIQRDYAGYWRKTLASVTAFGFEESTISASSVTEAERDAIFERVWNSGGGFQFMFATFNDIGVSRDANDAAAEFIKKKIRAIVKDPEVAALLTPHDLYARRPPCCDGYYETYNRENVTLVDVKSHPITEITQSGIRTDEAEYPLDVIVFATGFDAVTGNYLKFDQYGSGGVSLAERWRTRPVDHLGMMVADFPNMFMIFGPMGPFTNQPPAHEAQVDWIADTINFVLDHQMASIVPTHESEQGWMSLCDEIANATLFPQCNSWINGSNIPGKPVTVMFYMGGMGGYMEHLRDAADTEYKGFHLEPPMA
ncbi:MAG: flavin-containing monooxygenase [Acidimicrobiales bacterium]